MPHRFLRLVLGLSLAVLLVGAGAVPAGAAPLAGAVASQSLDDPPVDTDGDGIPDDVDQCPFEPGVPENYGCPYLGPIDSDGDGVNDDTDLCPSDPGSPAYNGCPAPDSDGDGLADDVDACPDLPGPYDGCPLTDLDGDGVYDDGSDLCPDQPGPPEHNGCPLPVVTATPPTFTDRCGKGKDTVTVPTSTGVVYRRGGDVIAAGTYRVRGTVTIVAEAADGYVLSGDSEWTAVLTNKVCPRRPAKR